MGFGALVPATLFARGMGNAVNLADELIFLGLAEASTGVTRLGRIISATQGNNSKLQSIKTDQDTSLAGTDDK